MSYICTYILYTHRQASDNSSIHGNQVHDMLWLAPFVIHSLNLSVHLIELPFVIGATSIVEGKEGQNMFLSSAPVSILILKESSLTVS